MRDEGYLTHQTALLNDPKYADMLLIAEGPPNPSTGAVERRTFYCHKVILASRSTYFDMLFGSGECSASSQPDHAVNSSSLYMPGTVCGMPLKYLACVSAIWHLPSINTQQASDSS